MDSRNRYWAALADPEVTRLTGTHAIFESVGVESWLRTRRDHHDRADWAILALAGQRLHRRGGDQRPGSQ
ncbi:MAG: hypothetical protein ACR2M5_15110, partial [Nakamurella sp.]